MLSFERESFIRFGLDHFCQKVKQQYFLIFFSGFLQVERDNFREETETIYK